ncbi:MAG: spore coat protein CotJB [Lachnospiraceae bacterium]|nr:spore coat protein CotJB [Lachnospiraceae bacterium]
MSVNNLAIANIPIQEWGELYSEEEALNIGTIFHDLNMPFFAAESVLKSKSSIASSFEALEKPTEQFDREKLMTKITQCSFFLDDLTLYLDTHENDMEAKQLYYKKVNESAELRKQFAQEFYPLTRLCIPYSMNENAVGFCWQDGPMPWEGACI